MKISDNSKRIAILVNSEIVFGGGERILGMIIDELGRKGYETYVYSYSKEWEKESGRFSKLRILQERPVLGHKYKSYRELRKVLREDRPGCLICFSLAFGEVAVWAARHEGVAFLTSERCDPWRVPVPGKESVHRLLRNLTFGAADGIVFQTPQVREFFGAKTRAHSRVIPNPVIDDNLLAPNPTPEKVIVGAGRLDDQKRFDILIDAFAALPPGHGYILKIYGQGELKEELQARIRKLGLENSVILMGQTGRLIEKLREADIFVLSSDHEGMPNALIEGLAMGLACISTDFASGGASRLIRNGENGLLIPPGDAQALTEALQSLISNSHLRERLRRAAVAIRETHSKERIIPMWTEYIENLATSNR